VSGLWEKGGVAEMSPLMTGWPCRYLFHFYLAQQKNKITRKQAANQKAAEVARSQRSLAPSLSLPIWLSLSPVICSVPFMLMQLIGANYAGRKGRGRFGRYVMQMRLTCVQHS